MTRLTLFVTLIALVASPALGQRRDRDRDRDRGPRFSKKEIERIIKRLEDNTDAFKKAIDRELDRSVLDGTKSEDRINDRVKDLEKSTDRLRKDFDRSDQWRDTRSDVEVVVRDARTVEDLFDRVRSYLRVRSHWNVVKADINALADAYDVRPVR